MDRKAEFLLTSAAIAFLSSGCSVEYVRPEDRILDPDVIAEAEREEAEPVQTTHTVQPGENLFRIALGHGIDVDDLARVNGIPDPALIYSGQELVISGVAQLEVNEQPEELPFDCRTYTVQPGDNLFRIALRHGVVDWHTINTANGWLWNNTHIRPGQSINIPGVVAQLEEDKQPAAVSTVQPANTPVPPTPTTIFTPIPEQAPVLQQVDRILNDKEGFTVWADQQLLPYFRNPDQGIKAALPASNAGNPNFQIELINYRDLEIKGTAVRGLPEKTVIPFDILSQEVFFGQRPDFIAGLDAVIIKSSQDSKVCYVILCKKVTITDNSIELSGGPVNPGGLLDGGPAQVLIIAYKVNSEGKMEFFEVR